MKAKKRKPTGTNNDQIFRVAIYTRKSTSKGLEDDDNSLQFQREACTDFIRSKKAHGWQVFSEHYDDGGFTGANTDRPALQKLLLDAKAGKFNAIAVYKVDRISRSVRDLVTLVEEFQSLDIEFVSVSQSFDTSNPIGRLILNILASFGQFERETIAERIRDKLGAVRRKGKYAGGAPPLGYDVCSKERKLVVNEEEAELVRDIFQCFKETQSLQAVLDFLHSRGNHTKRWVTKSGKVMGGKAINRGYLKRVLGNLHYLGKVPFEGEVFDGEHEAILDEDLFEEAQRILKKGSPVKRATSKNERFILLRGLIYCQACDEPMTYTYTVKKETRYFYYVCNKHARFNQCSSKRKQIATHRIETDVIGEIRAISQDSEVIAEITSQAAKQLRQDRDTLLAKQSQVIAAKKRLRTQEAYRRKKAGTAEANEGFLAKLRDLDEELSQTREALQATQVEISADDLRAAIQQFGPVWDALPFYDRSRLLNLLIERIDYNGNEGKYGTFQMFFRESGIRTLATATEEVA